MSDTNSMILKIFLPFGVFLVMKKVMNIVAETLSGSMGILPDRLDCVAVLGPGIVTCKSIEEGLLYIAVDEGVLIKNGYSVHVSVRNAYKGADLDELKNTVEKEFMAFDQSEENIREILVKTENAFIGNFLAVKHE